MNSRYLRHAIPTLFLLLLTAHARADSEYPNIDAACANNPERCEKAREKMAAKCQEDPAGCAEKKAKLDKKLGELKAKCEADPQACEEKKAKLRARMEQRRQNSTN